MSHYATNLPLGDISVWVMFEYTPGEAEEGPESRAAGPGVGASMVCTQVNICNDSGHGDMIDASCFSADQIALWEELALHEMSE